MLEERDEKLGVMEDSVSATDGGRDEETEEAVAGLETLEWETFRIELVRNSLSVRRSAGRLFTEAVNRWWFAVLDVLGSFVV